MVPVVESTKMEEKLEREARAAVTVAQEAIDDVSVSFISCATITAALASLSSFSSIFVLSTTGTMSSAVSSNSQVIRRNDLLGT